MAMMCKEIATGKEVPCIVAAFESKGRTFGRPIARIPEGELIHEVTMDAVMGTVGGGRSDG